MIDQMGHEHLSPYREPGVVQLHPTDPSILPAWTPRIDGGGRANAGEGRRMVVEHHWLSIRRNMPSDSGLSTGVNQHPAF